MPRPGEPDALSRAEEGAVERAARRRGVRDTAIVAVLKDAGARVEECARLDLDDVAITPRTGTVRLHGKGDQVRVVPLPSQIIAGIAKPSGSDMSMLIAGPAGTAKADSP